MFGFCLISCNKQSTSDNNDEPIHEEIEDPIVEYQNSSNIIDEMLDKMEFGSMNPK